MWSQSKCKYFLLSYLKTACDVKNFSRKACFLRKERLSSTEIYMVKVVLFPSITPTKQMLLVTDSLLTAFLNLGELSKCLCLSFMYTYIDYTTETLFYHTYLMSWWYIKAWNAVSHCPHWAVIRPPLVDPLLSPPLQFFLLCCKYFCPTCLCLWQIFVYSNKSRGNNKQL